MTVVTIVVLLILAGITITYVVGDNSVFKQASNAKLNTELAKIEEQASLIYTDKLLEKAQNNDLKDKSTMQDIIEELRDKGYTIEQVAVSEDEITGISLDKESMSLGKEKSNTIQVTLEGDSELYTYYIKVDGKYYKMHFNGGVITIDRTESDLSGGEGTKQILSVVSGDETMAIATVDTNTNVITVTAKNTAGTVAIIVNYGSYTKTCNVRVCEVTTELEINSVRARIATGYTRWLTAIAKPTETTSQEFEWTSSNKEVATVDKQGVITAKKKGTTTITVKTTDGSNLSKTCEVTVDDAVEVTTLTDFQTKNTIAKDENGNLITVPGDFKVLISEGTKVTQGIVIQDREGNEFVWVPIDSVSTGTSKPADDIRLGRYTFDSTYGTPKKEQDADNYEEVITINSWWQELTSSSTNTTAKNLGDFVIKTQLNGGYYIGRYEASQGSDRKVDSQFDKAVWGSITQPNAATAAREMYISSYVESDLINSYSWDTTIVFIQRYSEDNNYANQKTVNSRKLNTGKAGDKVCNIHDMSSNCREWSTESYNRTTKTCIVRGSCYGDSVNGTSHRGYGFSTTDNYDYFSFRPVLYMK